jgi:hypothetical protein
MNPIVPSSSVVALDNTASQNAGITTAPEENSDLESAPVPSATVVTQVTAGAPIPPANPVPTPSNLPYLNIQSRRWYTVTRGMDIGVFASW